VRSKAALLASVLLGLSGLAIAFPAAAAHADTLANLTAPAGHYRDYTATVSPPSFAFSGLSHPATAIAGQFLTITGSLVAPPSVPDAQVAGQTISVTRTVSGGAPTASFTTTTDANGDFWITDVPLTKGDYDYALSSSGTSTVGAASAEVVVPVSAATATLTLGRPSSVTLGQAVSLTGSLWLSGPAAGSGPPAPGLAVTITRTGPGSPSSFTATTGINGYFALMDTPSAAGVYTYTASYAGNSAISRASASASVAVQRVTALAVTTSAGTVGYDGKVTVTVHLGTTQSLRTVTLLAQTVGSRATRTLKVANVASNGTLTVSVPLVNSTTFTAKFAGDTVDTAASATQTVSVEARVAASLSGFYTSTRLGGVVYRVYHHTATLKDSVTVTPDKSGQCVELQVQRYYDRAWHAVSTSKCSRLNSKSQDTFSLKLGTAGQYRVLVYYVRSASDPTNVSTRSSWLGYEVVR
jgi:hypothetical protein